MKVLHKKNLYLLLVFIVISIPLFLFLGKKPIQLWDEGRNAMNALDMYWYGLSLITYYDGLPDLWNTKPPLLIWLQVISMEIFGVNEFGLRFPSAFAALITCFILFWFLRKYFNQYILGIIAVFVLVSSNGYVEVHGTRTGDYDSLLTLFLTANALFLFSFMETKSKLFIYLFFLSLAFAVLTKSIAALFYLPAYGLYILYDRKIPLFLKNKDFYLSLGTFIFIVGGYYFSRETLNPGYIEAVINNELGGRFNNVTDGLEERKTLFYFYNLINNEKRYAIWILFFIVGLIIGLFNKNKKIFKLSIYVSTILLIHFIVLTISKTKYHWYDTPWYPFMAILTSLCIFQIYNWIRDFIPFSSKIKRITSLASLIIILAIPYSLIVYKVAFSKSSEYSRNINLLSLYFQDVVAGKKMIENNIVMCSENENQYHALFYIELLRTQGKNIEFVNWENLQNGQILILGHDDNIKKLIETNYSFMVLENYQDDWEYYGLKKYKILGKKNEE